MYQLDYSRGSLAYDTFTFVGILHESNCHAGQDDQDRSFQKILARCESVTLEV